MRQEGPQWPALGLPPNLLLAPTPPPPTAIPPLAHTHHATGSKDGLLKLWCPRAGRCIATLHGHRATVMQAAWNANGHWVLSASRDASCAVHDMRMRRALASFRGPSKDVVCAAWHPIHEDLFVAGGNNGSLLYWLASRPEAPVGAVPAAHEGTVWSLGWHPVGHLLASGGGDFATKFWCR